MDKIHIDNASNEQLNYAVAVAQGWIKKGDSAQFWGLAENKQWIFPIKMYSPTTSQAQCGMLIDAFKIGLQPTKLDDWFSDFAGYVEHESRLIVACKSFLMSVYPDGLIPVETK